jgi:molecular chaperone DnaK
MAPRGVPQVEVTFDIDANGILSVKAKDKGTGKEQQITITASTNLSKDEIERMKKDAEMHAADDKKRHELIEAKNMAESMLYTTEKMMKEAKDVSDEDRKAVEEKLEALKKIKDTEDIEGIKKAGDELATAAQKVGEAMYKKQQNDAATAQPSAEGSAEGATEEKKEEPKDGDFTQNQ